jgi:serine/threonine-protein kinase HipA
MELADLTSVSTASVLVDGVPMARLLRATDRIRFEYLPDATSQVASGLPLSAGAIETHSAGALPPFFAGLLPEGRRLTSLIRAVKTSADDEFSLLLAVGRDTIGNVSVVPEGASADLQSLIPTVTLDNVAEISFAEIYRTSTGSEPDRFAMPGVQDKVSARMITFPVRGPETVLATHILKLNPPEFPHLVENESFFAAAARLSGLDVAETKLIRDQTGAVGLVVTRFDRVTKRRVTARRAQEDACQVLGRYPADKYAVTAEDIALGLSRLCQSSLVASLALVRQFAFAYLSCNGDAHAKNFSIVSDGDEWRVSPAYDLPSSYPYGDKTMAVRLNSKRDQSIGRNDFIEFGRHLGLRDAPILRALDEIADAAEQWIPQLAELPFDDRRMHDLTKAVRYRQRRLRGV